MTFARKQTLWRKLTLLSYRFLFLPGLSISAAFLFFMVCLSWIALQTPFCHQNQDHLKIYYFSGCGLISSLYTETNILARVIKTGNWETLTIFRAYGHLTWELLFPAVMSLAGRMEHSFPRICPWNWQNVGLVELADNVVKLSLAPPCHFFPILLSFLLHCHLQKENIHFSRLILHVLYCVVKCLMHLGFQNTILKYFWHLIFES